MRRFWFITLLLLLAGGVSVQASPTTPSQVTRRGLSQDLEFNLWSLNRRGYLSREKVTAIMEAYKDGSYRPDVTLQDDWLGDNFWVDRFGGVHRRVNGSDGKYHANRDPVPLVVDIVTTSHGTFMFRDSCRNLMVGPPPCVEKPKPPTCWTWCLKLHKQLVGTGGELSGHTFEVTATGGYRASVVTGSDGTVELKGTLTDGTVFEGTVSESSREHYRPVTKLPVAFKLTAANPSAVLTIYNEYCVPAPPPCKGSAKWCKRLTGSSGGSLEGHKIKLTRIEPSGFETVLVTDNNGVASINDLSEGEYAWEELDRESYRHHGVYSGRFRISRQSTSFETEVCNEYVPPTLSFIGEGEEEAPETPTVQGRVNAYRHGRPGKTIRSEAVANGGVMPSRRNVTVTRQQKTVFRPNQPPPVNIPPEGNKGGHQPPHPATGGDRP